MHDAAEIVLDAIQQPHRRYQGRARIVSLVPSITELVCDLGLTEHLAGRTGFCIHPAASLAEIPKVGGTKDVNIDKIRRLQPTHLIVNIDENPKPVVDLLAEFIPHVIVTHPLTVHDNIALYRLLGHIFDVQPRAAQLCQQLEAALKQLPAPAVCRKVLYCIWKDPWMTVAADTYIAAALRLIGWQVWQPTGNPARYPAFDWDMLPAGAIDAVLLSSEPYRFSQAELAELQQQLTVPVCLVDGEMISWYGSRAIAAVDYLQGLAGMTWPNKIEK